MSNTYAENQTLQRELSSLRSRRDELARRERNAKLEADLVRGGIGRGLAATAASMQLAKPVGAPPAPRVMASGGPQPDGRFSRETLESWRGEFGAENAIAWLCAGKSLAEARQAHNQRLRAAADELTREIEALRAGLPNARVEGAALGA